MFPAPALPGTTANLPLSWAPWHAGSIAGTAGPARNASAASAPNEESATLITPVIRHRSDGASQPSDTARRADRRPGARPRLREPRLLARRVRTNRSVLGDQAVDRLQARVQGLAARTAAPAREVHGALLPRRGDGVRRRPPSVRTLPPRGLPPVPRARRRVGRGRARRASARGAARWPHAPFPRMRRRGA